MKEKHLKGNPNDVDAKVTSENKVPFMRVFAWVFVIFSGIGSFFAHGETKTNLLIASVFIVLMIIDEKVDELNKKVGTFELTVSISEDVFNKIFSDSVEKIITSISDIAEQEKSQEKQAKQNAKVKKTAR